MTRSNIVVKTVTHIVIERRRETGKIIPIPVTFNKQKMVLVYHTDSCFYLYIKIPQVDRSKSVR